MVIQPLGNMRSSSRLSFLVLGILFSELVTKGQSIELEMPKPMELGNYVLNRMLQGAHNIIHLPSLVRGRSKPDSRTSQNSQTPESSKFRLPEDAYSVPQEEPWTDTSSWYQNPSPRGYGSQLETAESYERPTYQGHGPQTAQNTESMSWHSTEPSAYNTQSSSYGKSQPEGGGWGWKAPSLKAPYKRVCTLSQAPTVIINSAADIPPGSILRDPYGTEVDLRDVVIIPVPTPPNILRVGIRNPLPSNYSTTYVDRVEVNLDTTSNIGRPPYDIKMETHYRGNTQPPSDSILNPNTQRLKANSLQISTFVVQTPNNSAPIEGRNNPNGFFQAGIDLREQKFPNRSIKNPLELQIRALGQIFDQLWTIEEKALPVSTDSNSNSFSTGDQVDAPLLAVQIQRFTVPEPNSGERSILDSYFNFGLGAHPFEFGDLDLIREQYQVLRNQRPQVSVYQLGTTSPEISDTLTQWIRGYVRNFRRASAAAYRRGELVANQGFRQHQFFIHPPGDCPSKIDPPYSMGTTSLQCSSGGVCLKGPPPSCIPPEEC